LNYRLPDILCALGISQLKQLNEFKTKKRVLFQSYLDELSGIQGVELPIEHSNVNVNWHLFPARFNPLKRETIFSGLRKAGIGVQVNYIPAYWHPIFQDKGFKKGMYPNSDNFYSQEISLPMYSELTKSQIGFVIRNVVDLI
jgi:dTDP-4-amino-4,6-dideoxygalactose transaminase